MPGLIYTFMFFESNLRNLYFTPEVAMKYYYCKGNGNAFEKWRCGYKSNAVFNSLVCRVVGCDSNAQCNESLQNFKIKHNNRNDKF